METWSSETTPLHFIKTFLEENLDVGPTPLSGWKTERREALALEAPHLSSLGTGLNSAASLLSSTHALVGLESRWMGWRRRRPAFEGLRVGTVCARPLNLCVLGEELAFWDSLLPVARSHLACVNGRKAPFWTVGCGRWVEQTA